MRLVLFDRGEELKRKSLLLKLQSLSYLGGEEKSKIQISRIEK